MKPITMNTNDPKAEIVLLIMSEGKFFEHDRHDELRARVSGLAFTSHARALPAFPSQIFDELRQDSELSDQHQLRLNTISTIAEAEYYRLKKPTTSVAGNDEESEEEVPAEESDDCGDDEEGGASNSAMIREKLSAYTFAPEATKAYQRILEKRPVILIMHNTTVIIKDKTTDAWDTTKGHIKTVLNALGFESIFIAIDYAAEKYPPLKYLLKCIGSAIVPLFLVYMFAMTAFRIFQNPFKHVLNWLAKEFDFKSGEPEPVPE